ncbi:SDR family oxidoreductase [Candidatus Daviesbacteria bacterium]|nr:SDR family oxidoreductase [Candidatus Daviesbacteria bacterium]
MQENKLGLALPNSDEFVGKVVLITGGSSGIGLATANKFAEQGAYPIILDQKAPPLSNNEGAFMPVDVSDWLKTEQAVTRAANIRGGLDIVVNNAAFKIPGSILDISSEEFKRMLLSNGLGMWNVAKAALPHLIESRGVLINVCSGGSEDLPPNTDGYFASKGVSISLTHALHASFNDRGVSVIGIAPGPVDTPLWRTGKTSEQIALSLQGMRGPIVVQPDEIANYILCAASKNSSRLSGKVLSF